MLRTIKNTSTGLIAAAVLFVGLSASSAQASTTCIKKGKFKCLSTTTLTQFTGSPTIPCQTGDIVVKIDSKAECTAGSAGPVTVYRCGSFSNGFSYSGSGITHDFDLVNGDWADVLAGNCQVLKYKASQ